MQIHWPLVISTACQRVGLGMFICVFLADVCFGLALPLNYIALATLVLLCIGGIASIFHLQRPKRFFNAFSNIKSHLTQEAFITPFLGIALLVCGLNGIAYDLGSFGFAMEVVSALLSLLFLLATGLAYQMGSRPAWNTNFVLGLFLLTAAEAGSIAVVTVSLLSENAVVPGVSVAALVLFVACVALQFAYVFRMRHVGYGVAVYADKDPYRPAYWAWIVCGVVLTAIALAAALALSSGAVAVLALITSALGIVAWTVLFFKGALKVKMFPMYPVDLNLDM